MRFELLNISLLDVMMYIRTSDAKEAAEVS